MRVYEDIYEHMNYLKEKKPESCVRDDMPKRHFKCKRDVTESDITKTIVNTNCSIELAKV